MPVINGAFAIAGGDQWAASHPNATANDAALSKLGDKILGKCSSKSSETFNESMEALRQTYESKKKGG